MQTPEVALREITDSDLPLIFKGLSNPAVTKYYGVSFDSVEETREQMEWYSSQKTSGRGQWWLIMLEGEPVGAAGYSDLDEEGNLELGFWLYPEYWGKGIMRSIFPEILKRSKGFSDPS